MRVWNAKRTWNRPFFVHCRKHACPACGGDGYMFGKVKFIWTEFHCPRCEKKYAIDEIYRIEKQRKRRS